MSKSQPRLNLACVANRYAAPGERIAEFSFPWAATGSGDLPGGLISLRYRDGAPPVVCFPRLEGVELAPLGSLEDQFRDLLKRGLNVGTARKIMAEGAQEEFPAHIAVARRMATDELEIDDTPEVSPGGDPGVWVAAWVWVSDQAAGVETEEESADDEA